VTPVIAPAFFVADEVTGLYLPANKVATTLAAQMSKMRLSEHDLAAIKSRGFRVTKPNGEEINVGVMA
jgi:hypothetical protein